MKFNREDFQMSSLVVFKTTGYEIVDVTNRIELRYWDGRVNGAVAEDGNGSFFVPLWCDRMNREATTVMVHASNIVAILSDEGEQKK